MGKKNRKGMDIIVRNVEASAKTINIQVNIDGTAPAAAIPAAPAAPANRATRRAAQSAVPSNRPKFDLPAGQRAFFCLAIHPEGSTTCSFGDLEIPLVGGGTSLERFVVIGDAKAASTIPGLTNGDVYERNGLRCPACAAANVPFRPESKNTCEGAIAKFAAKHNTTAPAAVPSQGSSSVNTSTGTLSAADLVASAAAEIAANLAGNDRIPEDGDDLGNASTSALA